MPRQTAEDLSRLLRKLDRRGYKAYKELSGAWSFQRFDLFIDHVQGDPFAAPSRLRLRVPMERAAFPADTFFNKSREIALRDHLTRQFGRTCRRIGRDGGGDSRGGRGGPDSRRGPGRGRSPRAGSGKSGAIEIDMPGQEVIERSSCFVNEDFVEIRFVAGLPAFGRKIAGDLAETLLCEMIPEIAKESLFFKSLDAGEVYRAVETSEDADSLRSQLAERNLVAFVADGAVLPRRSGVDERPMERGEAVPFRSPDSLRISFDLPNRGPIEGMGITRGVTLITGGGYHGKSTLLNAVDQGIYNHIPGDGREFVVADPLAYKVRAEDGRRIERTSITPFISNLPYGRDTDAFCSENASGSTSQAANIIEAIEAGASALMIDEDTSATNFMIRDHRMQELVAKDNEPITPFIDKVRQLYSERGVSTILFIGGSGDYFDVADVVIGMKAYVPEDVTAEARRIAEKYRSERSREGGESFGRFVSRAPLPAGIDPSRGKKGVKIKIRGAGTIDFGSERIDLSAIEQLIHPGQARAIAAAMVHAKGIMDGRLSMAQLLDRLSSEIEEGGLDALAGAGNGRKPGDLVKFRRLELAAALNRLRSFKVKQL